MRLLPETQRRENPKRCTAPSVTIRDMEEVPRSEWPGPSRLDPAMLDKIMVPGGKWFRLEPGVDFSVRVPFSNIRDRLYRAAKSRGGRCVLYQEPDGSVLVYATECS